MIGNNKVESITKDSVQIMDKNWNRGELKADTIVAAFGMKSNMKTIQELSGIIAETYIIGDCDKVSSIHNANTSAFNYAVEC